MLRLPLSDRLLSSLAGRVGPLRQLPALLDLAWSVFRRGEKGSDALSLIIEA